MEEIQTPRPQGTSQEQENSSIWLHQLLSAVGLLALCIAAYWPLYHAGYVWDDDVWLTNNGIVQHWSGLWYIWFVPHASTQYYPLIYTAFLLQFKMWGLNPLGYHLINIVLQAINAILLWRILRRLKLKGAWIVAAVFAIHPVQVETVGWITEQKNLLSGLFYFSAILFWLRCGEMDPAPITDSPHSRSWNWKFYLAASGFFFLALLAKTDACTLPAVLLLLAWWKKGRITKREILALIPWFVLALILAAMTIYVEHGQAGALGPAFDLSLSQRIIIAGMDLWFYPFKLLWPHPLLAVYPRWNVNPYFFWCWIFPIAACAVLAVLWLWRKKIGRGPFMAVAYYGITIAPVLGFTPFYTMVYTFVADHYEYLACIGIIVLIAVPAARGMEKFHTYLEKKWNEKTRGGPNLSSGRLLPATAALALLAELGVLTWGQSQLYRSPAEIWNYVLNYDPNSWLALDQRGTYELQAGDLNDAVLDYFQAYQITKGDNFLADAKMAYLLLYTHNDYRDAEPYLEQSVRLNPYQPDYIDALAECYEKLGRMDRAAIVLQNGIKLMPETGVLYRTMGEYYGLSDQFDKAIEQFHIALKYLPDDISSMYDLAVTFASLGRGQEAMDACRQTLDLNPDFFEARLLYGKLLLADGQPEAAADNLREAVRLRPESTESHLALVQALEETGDIHDAAIQRAMAMELQNQVTTRRSMLSPTH
jgi:protein O-mannosyl-transferase